MIGMVGTQFQYCWQGEKIVYYDILKYGKESIKKVQIKMCDYLYTYIL